VVERARSNRQNPGSIFPPQRRELKSIGQVVAVPVE
jgi:hypothetical protein